MLSEKYMDSILLKKYEKQKWKRNVPAVFSSGWWIVGDFYLFLSIL